MTTEWEKQLLSVCVSFICTRGVTVNRSNGPVHAVVWTSNLSTISDISARYIVVSLCPSEVVDYEKTLRFFYFFLLRQPRLSIADERQMGFPMILSSMFTHRLAHILHTTKCAGPRHCYRDGLGRKRVPLHPQIALCVVDVTIWYRKIEESRVAEIVGERDRICQIHFSCSGEVHSPGVSFSKIKLQRWACVTTLTSVCCDVTGEFKLSCFTLGREQNVELIYKSISFVKKSSAQF